MSESLVIGSRERLRKIKRIEDVADRLQDSGYLKRNRAETKEAAEGDKLIDEACALCWALGYVRRHVNDVTGELLPEPEPGEAT